MMRTMRPEEVAKQVAEVNQLKASPDVIEQVMGILRDMRIGRHGLYESEARDKAIAILDHLKLIPTTSTAHFTPDKWDRIIIALHPATEKCEQCL